MKIESRNVGNSDKFNRKRVVVKSGASFLDTLNEIDMEQNVEFDTENLEEVDIKNLATLIAQLGEDLSQNPTPDVFTKYKKHIKILISLMRDNVEVRDIYARKSFHEQKLFKTIEVIDDNLANLATLILSGEKNRIRYLNLTNNIKGLIVDLIW